MEGKRKSLWRGKKNVFIPIATKLMLSYTLIILLFSAMFIFIGVRLISDRFISEAQEKVRNDLNSAREIYLSKLRHISDVIQLTSERFFLKEALISNDMELAKNELMRIKEAEGLDVLTITDKYGYVLYRTSSDVIGDNQGERDSLVHAVLNKEEPVGSTVIIKGEDLMRESPDLAQRAYVKFIDTPLARPRVETDQNDGMMLKAAAPIFDNEGKIIGTLYGGVLLNQNYEIVDKVKQTVYQDVKYKGQDIGTATIFQDDVRISTNVNNEDGLRAIGTRVSKEVYDQVILERKPWIDRAYVVTNWYITAYEPIIDVYGRIIGILYVGLLEQKYLDIKNQAIITFLAVAVAGAIVSLAVSYLISQKFLIPPINKLVSASQEVALGNLDAKVEIDTSDELEYLADSFNAMAKALKERDEQLREFTTQKIMESERLALIGQLSANVAHELNNPLQGIVAYSYLLLEKISCDDPIKNSVDVIVGQANRCRDIIRGLLDFSRQRKPDKILSNINTILNDCISLLENQALFLNIQIIKNLQESLPLLVIDPSQIERVFVNLIINAAEAMEGNGKLVIASRFDPVNEFVELKLEDTGQGIEKKNLEILFDPFFTTKEVGHGTGLGLAISYGIIKAHKGTISVESEVGVGTIFTIYLPLDQMEDNGSNGR